MPVMKKEKVVLAYSGGLDTSVIVRWLEQKGYEVICFCANVGQEEKYKDLEKKALNSGGSKCYIRNVQEEFVRDFVFPAIAWNAKYEGRYLLGTSLARPIIANIQRLATREGPVRVAPFKGRRSESTAAPSNKAPAAPNETQWVPKVS